MTYYKIVCMESFTERLFWAIRCAGMDPMRDQSRIAGMIGKPCKPQNIQHLLNADNAVAHSKYTLDLARVLECDPFWLGKGIGIKPELRPDAGNRAKYQYLSGPPPVADSPTRPHYLWPFKGFTFEEYNQLDEKIKEGFENIILATVKNRGDPEKQEPPATKAATIKSA